MNWSARRAKYLLDRVRREPRDSDGIVTAFRDGRVTLRSNRREDGFTNAELEIGYQGIRVGDLVIHGMDGFAGAIGVSESDGKASPVVHAYLPAHDCEPRYYAYLLRHLAQTGFIESLAKGIRQRSTAFDSETLLSLFLPLPALQTQIAIADYLDTETARIDALIIKKHRIIELLRDCRNEVRRQTVENIDPDATKLRQFRRLVLRSHAGEVIDQSWWGSGEEVLYTCATDPVMSNFPSFPSDRRTSGNDILLTRNGTPYIHLPSARAIFTNVVQRVVLRDDVDREFIALALDVASKQMHRQGVSIDSLNFTMWKELRVPLPSLSAQRTIVESVRREEQRLDALGKALKLQLILLSESRQALITAAVTGELEIPEVAA
jgi:type I restriction enzyme S subunit